MQVDYADALGKHHFDVAVLDLSVVGLIETELRADHVWIENIAIAPEAQGRGIGQKLMAHVEAKALAAGLSDVRLLTNGAFDANLRFYHQQGFQTDRVESFKGGVAVYMSKNLTP